MIRTLLKGVGIALALLATVVLLRTLLHGPIEREPIDVVTIELDEQAIASRLAESIRFQTISHQNDDMLDKAAFQGFIGWVAETYPQVRSELSLQRFGLTLLCKWEGTDTDLQPVLVTGH